MDIKNIKFKAKRLDNGEWIEGDLIHKETYVCIGYLSSEIPNITRVQKVDTSTVCMFTGLKDCDGKEIWEGDMLSNVTNDSPDGIVTFKYGAFSLLAKNGRDFCVALTYLMSEKDSLNRFKVIGNKFDKQRMKSIFSMFAYWDRVHQFPDGHIKVENNLAWRRKHMHFRSSKKNTFLAYEKRNKKCSSSRLGG